jgi:phosphate transport system protein
MSTTIRTPLDHDLRYIQDELLRMASMLNNAVSRAVQAMANRDVVLARQLIADDAEINALRFEIEEKCVVAIATQQPAAGDLRAIVAAMNIVSDLERMADHAAGIAKVVVKMGDEPLLKPLVDIPRMAEECRNMITGALDAYMNRDAEMAHAIAQRDDIVDGLYQQIFRELLTFMLEDPKTISRALYLLFAAHILERIGDRAVNIAERVIFLTSGKMKELNAGPMAPV